MTNGNPVPDEERDGQNLTVVAQAKLAERDSRERCWGFFDWLCKLWKIIVDRPETGDPCVTFPGHIINKPDPCIYSQFLLMQLEQPVTWDNPDVRIFLAGVEQDTYNLTVDTVYDVHVEVHNSSRSKPAVGTSVYVRWIEWGAGGQIKHLIATLTSNVPVWPGTQVVTTTWRTPATPGHYCIEVELVHPDDGNPANNRGWNNTQVHQANSPVHEAIKIFNQYPNGCPEIQEGGGPRLRPHRVFAGWGVLGAIAGFLVFRQWTILDPSLERVFISMGAGYVALTILGFLSESAFAWMARRRRQKDDVSRPERIPCNLVELTVDSYEFADEIGKGFDHGTRFQGKAPEWPARVEPSNFLFADGEAFREVELIVEAPDDPGPPAVFNVNARQGGVPAGGVTITISR